MVGCVPSLRLQAVQSRCHANGQGKGVSSAVRGWRTLLWWEAQLNRRRHDRSRARSPTHGRSPVTRSSTEPRTMRECTKRGRRESSSRTAPSCTACMYFCACGSARLHSPGSHPPAAIPPIPLLAPSITVLRACQTRVPGTLPHPSGRCPSSKPAARLSWCGSRRAKRPRGSRCLTAAMSGAAGTSSKDRKGRDVPPEELDLRGQTPLRSLPPLASQPSQPSQLPSQPFRPLSPPTLPLALSSPKWAAS